MSTYARKTPEYSHPFLVSSVKGDVSVNARKGIIEGYLTKYMIPGTQTPVIDPYKDIVETGAFTKTIKDLEKSRELKNYQFLTPHLWQHNPSDIIGGVRWFVEDEKGVIFETQLAKGVKKADEALELIDQGMLPGISYGYDAIRAPVVAGVRHLKEVRLHETSSVTFPANEYAGVTGVKSVYYIGDFPIGIGRKDDMGGPPMDLNDRLAQQEPMEAMSDFYTLMDTFSQAVMDHMQGGLSDNLSMLVNQFTIQLAQWAQENAGCLDGSQDDMSTMSDSRRNYLLKTQSYIQNILKDTQPNNSSPETPNRSTLKGWDAIAPSEELPVAPPNIETYTIADLLSAVNKQLGRK